jgi:DNA-binding MarR family transcriptional regulator
LEKADEPAINRGNGVRVKKVPLESMPGHLLRRCHQIGVAIFLEACAEYDLTPLQFAVLQTLVNDGAQDQVTLGGATAMDRTSIALLVRNLEQRGLLKREKSSRDQRAKIVTITATGRKLLKTALPTVESAQRRILAPLDQAEAARLLELLGKLAENNNALSRAPARLQRRSA